MPKTHHTASKPKEKTTLADPRYESGAALKSMKQYENMLFKRSTTSKIATKPRLERETRARLSELFQVIH